MEVSLNWIRKYVDVGAETPVAELSRALTSLGLEVEGVVTQGAGLSGVVAAEVLECGRHPEADKLSVCKVSDGTEVFPVVCGAANVAKGQKVLLAKLGAELPGKDGQPGLKIKKAKLRGQESHGMLCAEDELGLGDSHDGILILDPAVAPGTPLQSIPGLTDTLLSLNVTPNRPDALCHVGVARELAAWLGKPLGYPAETLRESGAEASASVSIAVEDEAGCTQYIGRVIRGVKVGPSPAWLIAALKSIGKRSINNVVDLTNYVLWELGQPSHAFDLDKISGGQVIIRRGRAGETLATLDGVERKITSEDLVIADAQGPLVLAGVMGGQSTEVGAATTSVFLEVAYFNPAMVRRQGKRHGLSSDSSYRFERGVDPLNTAWVSDYLAALMVRWCGGEVAPGRIARTSAQHPTALRQVAVRPARATKLLGLPVTEASIVRQMESIGLARQGNVQVNGEDALNFSIPGFRGDLEREADLIEEIARITDLNAIPAVLPALPIEFAPLPPSEELAHALRHFLRDAGLNETLNLRFSSRKALAKLGLADHDARRNVVPLRNPLSEEWEILPTTTLPSLLTAVGHNQNNQERDCRFFEIAKAFYHHPEERSERLPGVWEEEFLYIVLSGEWPDRRLWTQDAAKATAAAPVELYHLKGLLENLSRALRLELEFAFPSGEAYLHPRESGVINAHLSGTAVGSPLLGRSPKTSTSASPKEGVERIGSFGVLHPRVAAHFDLQGPILVAEISLTGLIGAQPQTRKFKSFGAFSAVTRDVNLVVDENRNHAEIMGLMPLAKTANLKEVRLNSVYRGQGVSEGKKALHYSFVYRHAEKTLTDEEVNRAQDRLKEILAADPGIVIK